MDKVEERYCRLCLGVISNDNFEKISDIAEEILDILLLKLDLDKSKDGMCKVCAEKVMEALRFKSMCLNTDKTIIPYVDFETGSSVDLLEIYTKEKGNKKLIETYDPRICRLCMHLIKDKFISICDREIDVIEQYIPEMIISIVKNPVVCKTCFVIVGIHSTFLKNCLKVEEKINSFREGNPSCISAFALCIKTENGVTKQEESEQEKECLESKLTVETLPRGDQYEIKTECIEIKWEGESESETISRSNPTNHRTSMQINSTGSKTFKCIYCNFESEYKYSLKRHILNHEQHLLNPMEVVKIMNMLGVRKPLHFEKLTCAICNFTTFDERKFCYHQLKHEGQKPYVCTKCNRTTWTKASLKVHMRLHKSPAEVQLFKCQECDYNTRYKVALKDHQYRHTLKTKMCTCTFCGYKANSKIALECHVTIVHESVLSHENSKMKPPPKLRKVITEKVYKCNKCTFQTVYKSHFINHRLLHKDTVWVRIYKCDSCSYLTRYSSNLKNHQLIHGDPLQVECTSVTSVVP